MDKLLALRKDVQIKSEQMEKSVKVAEREYSRKMSDLNKGFEVSMGHTLSSLRALTSAKAVGQSFAGMENKMSEVGRTAIRIGEELYYCVIVSCLTFIPGEQLEAVHVQRQRAQAAHDLINYYIQFSRRDTTALDVLRKERGKEGRRELATILRRLGAVAREVDIPTAEQVSTAPGLTIYGASCC